MRTMRIADNGVADVGAIDDETVEDWHRLQWGADNRAADDVHRREWRYGQSLPRTLFQRQWISLTLGLWTMLLLMMGISNSDVTGDGVADDGVAEDGSADDGRCGQWSDQ